MNETQSKIECSPKSVLEAIPADDKHLKDMDALLKKERETKGLRALGLFVASCEDISLNDIARDVVLMHKLEAGGSAVDVTDRLDDFFTKKDFVL